MKLTIEVEIGNEFDTIRVEKLVEYLKNQEATKPLVEAVKEAYPQAEELSAEEEAMLDIPFHTQAEIKNLVTTKIKAGKRDEMKALLKEFGATNVTELAEDKYYDFVEKARKC